MNTDSKRCRAWTSREANIVAPPRRFDLVVEELDGEIVFTDPVGEQTFHLNPTAYEIWKRCDGHVSMRRIAHELTEKFDVDLDDALDDVEQVVTSLAEAGLLVTGESG